MNSVTLESGNHPTPSDYGLLAKERSIAGPTYNRWLLPPAALAVHLCIGMAYGFSVFWLPLSRAIGINKPQACAADTAWLSQLFTTSCDWSVSLLNVTFTLFIVVLGLSAALWGGWLERAGPRKAGVVAALCWSGGLILGGIGVYLHQLWIIWLGCGVVGGVGLGLGYISPVSTLIKWFPDRRGMATGMAIMGFGGGAMIGAPLADKLMKNFATPTSVGAWQTLMVLGLIYLVFMLAGAFGYRVPAPGWTPKGWVPSTNANAPKAMITGRNVHLNKAWKTRQFWLIWGVLCMNVSAGIGVLAMASPMLQEVFGGRLIGVTTGFSDLSIAQKAEIASIAAGFTGLLSLFNIIGRFFWASLSDRIGRKITYATFFLLGIALYASAPSLAHAGSIGLFVATFCVILSMYGGGFATVPAYLADIFGTQMVGAIHGRLLTAWSTAGVIGPLLIAALRDTQINAGVPRALVYDTTMYILSGLLVIGFICNLLIKPVAESVYMTPEELEAERRAAHDKSQPVAAESPQVQIAQGSINPAYALLAWGAVGIPLAWGVYITLLKVAALF
jgi:MFS family permease